MCTRLTTREWETSFLNPGYAHSENVDRALIILNQPFSMDLLDTLWPICSWRCCADGGGNRLYDALGQTEVGRTSGWKPPLRNSYIPDMIKGDLDSLRQDVREYYSAQGVPIFHDPDQDSTDLMKCVKALEEKERAEGHQYELFVFAGFSGRLDQTIHTLSYLHKLRKSRTTVYAISEDNICWVLDEGEHRIHINHDFLGPTCGLLPLGVDSTVLSTSGLRWNLDFAESSFDGLISTSNHLLPEEPYVTVKTSRPIWWCVELRKRR